MTIDAQGLNEGPFLAQPSSRASEAKIMVALGGANSAGRRRVPGESTTAFSRAKCQNPSHAPPCCEGKAVRGVAPPILPFNHLHWRPLPEGWWRFNRRIEELQDIFTKI